MKLNFCETLNALCSAVGPEFKKNSGTINVTTLARAIRINQPTLTRMLNGQSKEPGGENADKLCRFFGIDRDQLLGNKPIAFLSDSSKGETWPQIKDKPNGLEGDPVEIFHIYRGTSSKIPVISLESAGVWMESEKEARPAEDWIDWPSKTSKDAYAVRNSGVSMFNPRTGEGYPDGCILKIEPETVKPAVNGSDVIVRTPDGAVTFKQLQIDGNNKYLSAINPDWPERIIKIPKDSVICGVCDGYFMRTGK
jgi:SOS-response transcriptional repressor LexA